MDPRDYVYARLGYSVGFNLLGLKSDYTMSTERLFADVTVYYMRRERAPTSHFSLLRHPRICHLGRSTLPKSMKRASRTLCL